MDELGPLSEDEARIVEQALRLLRSPELKQSVTFQRFMRLVETMGKKLEAGEDVSRDAAEMVALNAAIKAEMAQMKAVAMGGTQTPS